MAHFYSGISGSRGPATRCGTKGSGISGYVQGWGGRIAVSMYFSEDNGRDHGYVSIEPGPSSSGRSIRLADDIDPAALTAHATDATVMEDLDRARALIRRASDRATDLNAARGL